MLYLLHGCETVTLKTLICLPDAMGISPLGLSHKFQSWSVMVHEKLTHTGAWLISVRWSGQSALKQQVKFTY